MPVQPTPLEPVRLGRRVAIKLPSADLEADPSFRERFVRESRAAASLDHPNVLPVYAAGEEGGRLYLAMRHVEGFDLAEVILREGPMGIDRVVRIVAQIADALDAAHDRGLVHRDVKPSNVLLDPDDRAYLSDFGLAKLVETTTVLTASANLVGTLDYVSPEAIEGREVDGRADQYALGCVAFEMLTGRPPFRRANEAATLYAHLHDPLPSVASAKPELTASLDSVLRRATEKDPDDRFPTSSGFAAALADTISEPPSSRRRRPMPWIAAAVLLAVVAIGVWFFAFDRDDDAAKPARRLAARTHRRLARLKPWLDVDIDEDCCVV